jgi:arylsulfatase A-like enzyme
LLASLAALTGQKLAAADGPDSLDHLPALLGRSTNGRAELVEAAGGLSLRQGQWKYIEPNKRQKINKETNTELGNDSVPQLYDLSKDPGEMRNLAPDQSARVQAMAAELEKIRKAGRRR